MLLLHTEVVFNYLACRCHCDHRLSLVLVFSSLLVHDFYHTSPPPPQLESPSTLPLVRSNLLGVQCFISFHFILKFFKEGNPSANMLVFKGPSN